MYIQNRDFVPRDLLTAPYGEGVENFKNTFKPFISKSLSERVKHLFAGAALIIPGINAAALLILTRVTMNMDAEQRKEEAEQKKINELAQRDVGLLAPKKVRSPEEAGIVSNSQQKAKEMNEGNPFADCQQDAKEIKEGHQSAPELSQETQKLLKEIWA